MKKTTIFLLLTLWFFGNQIFGQEVQSPAESRKKNLKELLDYRYRGGFYSFERLFFREVEFNEYALKNCVIGIMIVRFEVDCEGEIKNLVIKNPLGWGLNQQVQSFLQKTQGNWNKCDDDRYTRFEVPIQFTINDTETNSTDAMIVMQKDLTGYNCKPDSYYQEKFDDAFKKGKKKKALKYLQELIKRDPYKSELYELRKELLEGKK